MVKLRVLGLRKTYGAVVALRDVGFDLGQGELLSLLGPSGCGKTTTLRVIAGFDRPDAGTVTLDGRDLLPVPPEKRRIGFVFQNYALFPHMTVEANVAYGVRFDRRINARDRVRELLALVGLQGFERRRPAELSSGQQQRVALARALAPRPRLLLLDEPLSALDAKLRETLRSEIRRIQRDVGQSTLYVTHDQEEALALSDRIAVMADGRIEQAGAPKEVYLAPQTPFVAGFVGPTNRLAGTVAGREGSRVLVRVNEATIRVPDPGVRIGDPVLVFLRLEALRVDGSAGNRIAGLLGAVTYQGASSLLEVASALGPLRVRVAEDRAGEFHIGDSVILGFEPADALVFPA
jgi:thiamine transport system ATP-binding protein